METQTTIEQLESSANNLTTSLNGVTTVADIEPCKKQLDELRDTLRQCVEWWPQYDIRRGQLLIESLEQLVDAQKRRIKPRKRFKFKYTATSSSPSTSVPDPSPVNDSNSSAAPKSEQSIRTQEEVAIPDSNLVQVNIQSRGDSVVLTSSEVSERGVKIDDPARIGGGKVTIEEGALSLWLVNLRACTIEAKEVMGPVWITNCNQCIIVCGCRQLRIHDTNLCNIFVSVVGASIIERSTDMRFGPLPERSEEDNGQWKNIKDMSWLREGESKNWRLKMHDDSDEHVIQSGLQQLSTNLGQ